MKYQKPLKNVTITIFGSWKKPVYSIEKTLARLYLQGRKRFKKKKETITIIFSFISTDQKNNKITIIGTTGKPRGFINFNAEKYCVYQAQKKHC